MKSLIELVQIFVIAIFAIAILSVSSSPIVFDVTSERATNNSLIVGRRLPGDLLIYHENITEKFSWIGQKVVLNRTVKAPISHLITQVKCLDEVHDGTGAEVAVTAGGPGQSWVELRFKSQRFHGIYYDVQIYAKRM